MESEEERRELQRIAARMRLPQCALATDSAGGFRGSAIVRWLVGQALASSREQAIGLASAMLRARIIEAVGQQQSAFKDGNSMYRFV